MYNLTKNLLSCVLALVATAVVVSVIVGVLWLVPIILMVLGGIGLFIIFRVLLEDTEEGGG